MVQQPLIPLTIEVDYILTPGLTFKVSGKKKKKWVNKDSIGFCSLGIGLVPVAVLSLSISWSRQGRAGETNVTKTE